ncbi:putative gustatory receptor 98b [Musca autumnalis]|uniref:putative gustatory receptor 98b n=1 Tax=Musca autumnalis TaxID=221902 RepID=UPI003CFAA8A2
MYSWIFSLFGQTLPPVLIDKNRNCWLHCLLFSIYSIYSIVLGIFALYTSHVHHQIISHNSFIFDLDVITKILSYAQNILLVGVQIFMEIKTIFAGNQLRDLLELLAELEYDLIVQCAQCPNSFNKYALKWKLLKISDISFVVLLTFLLYLGKFLTAEAMDTSFRIGILFFMAAMQMKCIEYSVYVQVVFEFLQAVYGNLVSIIQNLEHQPANFDLIKQLLKNQMILNRVLSFVSRMGEYFAWHLLAVFFYNGEAVLNIFNSAYVIHLQQNQDEYVHFRILYIVIMLTSIFIVSALTQRCIRKYNSIGALIHNVNVSTDECDLFMRLREYSMQMMHQNLIFTCNGYMDIDFKCFGKMLLLISSYVIILVQFKMEEANKGSLIAPQHIFGKNI